MENKLQIHELINELQFATDLSTPLKTVLLLQNGLKALKENDCYQTILKKGSYTNRQKYNYDKVTLANFRLPICKTICKG
jgi:hypothetical protein